MDKKLVLIIQCFLSAVAGLSVIWFAFASVKPFTLDEAEYFARAAHEINEIGFKMYGNIPEGSKQKTRLEVAHPLLYNHLFALWYKIFGESTISGRLFGVFCYLITLLLLFYLTRICSPPETSWPVFLFSGILYFLNPLLIQHAMLLDIDNSILTVFIVAFCLVFLKNENETSIKSRLLPALFFALALCSKEVTTPFILVAVIIYRLLKRETRQAILDFCLIGIGGFLLFWFVWVLYCKFTGVPVMAFVEHGLANKGTGVARSFISNPGAFISSAFSGFTWPMVWASASFFVLLFLSFFSRVSSVIKKWHVEKQDLLWILGIIIWTVYQLYRPTPDMMKYQYPAYPLFIICISIYLVNLLNTPAEIILSKHASGKKAKRVRVVREATIMGIDIVLKKSILIYSAIILCITLTYYIWIGDPLLNLYESPYGFLFAYLAPLFLCVFFIKAFAPKIRMSLLVAYICILFMVAQNTALNFLQIRNYTTCESWLNYGERGLSKVVHYLKDKIKPGDIVYSRKDINYYLRDVYDLPAKNFFNTKNLIPALKKDRNYFHKLIKRENIRFIVIDPFGAPKAIQEIISPYFELVEVFGKFPVYENKTAIKRRKSKISG
ncbi:MAG: glycosyltransferase family 39 protein [Candidatus Theseobacter exili]|nr:glycosyltransferase family 39 protein [Candidatus Theseobacter exili]